MTNHVSAEKNKPFLTGWWANKPLRHKMRVVFLTIAAAFTLFVGMTVALSESQLATVSDLMQDYHLIGRFISSYHQERTLFRPAIYSSIAFQESEHASARERTDRILNEMQRGTLMQDKTLRMYTHALTGAVESYRAEERTALGFLRGGDIRNQTFIDQYYQLDARAEYISQYAGLLLASSIETGEGRYAAARARSRKVYALLLVAIGLCGLILCLTLRLLQNTVFRPVLALSCKAEEITAGRFDTPDVPVRGRDELSMLTETFNIMKRELSHTFDTLSENARMEKNLRRQEVKNAQIQKLLERTRFAQLQSQMNPHFLFNSLNTASALATLENAGMTRSLIGELAAYFRYTLESDEDIVTLSRELDIVETYMEIQQKRFGGRLRLDLKRAPEFETILIPKYILQPLVENSVVHGLARKPEGGVIRIRIREPREGCIELSVIDNGAGTAAPARAERRSIGLDNIRRRLHLFDPGSSVTFWCKKQVGAVTRLCFHLSVTDTGERIPE